MKRLDVSLLTDPATGRATMDRSSQQQQLLLSFITLPTALLPYLQHCDSVSDSQLQSFLSLPTLRPQATPTTSRVETLPVPIDTTVSSPIVAVPTLCSLYSPVFCLASRGRGRGRANAKQVVVVISFFCLCSLRTATAVTVSNSRKLEEEWTSDWDGKWTAQQGDDYVYECNEDCQENKVSGNNNDDLWLQPDELALTPDQIITYVTLGIFGFMTLLCCVCYPEILVVPCGKLCGYCCGAGGQEVSNRDGLEEGDDTDCDYVGGKQWTETKNRRKSKKKSSTRTKPSRDVELV